MYVGTTMVRSPVPWRIRFDFGIDCMGRVIRKCQVYPCACWRPSPFWSWSCTNSQHQLTVQCQPRCIVRTLNSSHAAAVGAP